MSAIRSVHVICILTTLNITSIQGYISIFPFLLGLLKPDSPHLGPILEALRDPEQLWSDYGIRSLSKSHPLNGQGENYWRGPIWIPLNYLALQSLYNVRFCYP